MFYRFFSEGNIQPLKIKLLPCRIILNTEDFMTPYLENFSSNDYQTLLDTLIREGYHFNFFDDFLKQDLQEPSIILRHDVDTSLDYALQMAVIEAEHNIFSTYFVMLRSPLYNLWSRANARMLDEIQNLGHKIALHFDYTYAETNNIPVAEQLLMEAETLSRLTQAPVTSFSLHQPTKTALQNTFENCSLINTYDKLVSSRYEYISDSNMDWRGKNIFDFIYNKKDIQLLTHPMWWLTNATKPSDAWNEVICKNFQNEQNQILETERSYGDAKQIILKSLKK